MLGATTFYHGSLRRYIAAFGLLFDDFTIDREDSGGSVIQQVKIPIRFGPKQMWYYRDTQDPHAGDVSNNGGEINQLPIQAVFPAMAYEVTGISYIENKKGLSTIKNVALGTDNTTLKRTYNTIPVRIAFSLYIVAKNQVDGYMILEQILPFFTPDFTVRVKDETDLGLIHDIPFVLQYPIGTEDNWNGDFNERREINWTLNFTCDGWIYGPVKVDKIITEAQIRMFIDSETSPFNTTNIRPNPTNAMPNTDFGFTES